MKRSILPAGGTAVRAGLSASVAAVALLAMWAAAPALAQQAAPPTQTAEAPIETVTVTGTRISGADAASANPITVVGSQAIQQEESNTIEQILTKTPSVDFNGGISSASVNGGLGASEFGLRNLQPQRTLVLVNGERFPFTDTQGSVDAVDMNNIPVSMIDHIEILRDGASSIYGADAIGGVINVITKQHFEGVEVGTEVGVSGQGDGIQYDVYSTVGADFDRGNILINVEDSSQDPILGSARAWATNEHPEAAVNPNLNLNAFDGISSRITGAIGVISTKSGGLVNYYFPNGLKSGIPAANAGSLCGVQLGDGGVCTGGGLTPGDIFIPAYGSVYYDYLPNQGVAAGLDRKQANFVGHYDIFPDVTATIEAFYTDRQSSEQLNPEPTGYNTPTPQFANGLYISPTYINSAGQTVLNPYNPTNNAAFVAASGAVPNSVVPILTRRFENGPREYTDDINTYRLRGELTGTFYNDYTWAVGYLYGQSDAVYRVANETNFYHLSQELGMNPCGTAIGCSVANFLGYGTLTRAQANYLSYTNTDNSGYELADAYGSVSGPLYTLPAGDVKFAAGFEYKTDSLFDNPDAVTAAGDGAVYSAPTQGAYATGSGYVEVNAPLLKNLPFVKMLTADASGRYDYNTTFGPALTHKEGLDYAINDDFRLRGSHETGFRAPQVKELYGGHYLTEPGGTDPCATNGAFVGSAACRASMVAVGLPANTVPGQISQISQIAGGNPSLRPETSQAWSMGGVFTPEEVPGLSVAVDYYTILVRDEIGSLLPQSILNLCYGNIPYTISRSAACALIGPRNSLTGSLGNVTALNGNSQDENTSGIDFDVNYNLDMASVGFGELGKLNLNGQAEYLLSDNLLGVGGSIIQQAGAYGTDGETDNGEPRWKAVVSATLNMPSSLSVNFTEQYIGGVRNITETPACVYFGNCTAKVQTLDYEGNETAGLFYTDISATYVYNNLTFTVGINNLFDKDPPFLFPNVQDNTIAGNGYDFLGRYFFMKAKINFGAGEAPKEVTPAPVPPPAPAPAPVAPAPKPEAQREFQVFFDFDKSNITEAAAQVIQQAADVVKSGGIAHITVTGHTDTVGTAKYNQALSERRAASVKAEMVKDGVDGGEISTVGVGKTGLLVPTADGVREPQNRRAVIQLM